MPRKLGLEHTEKAKKAIQKGVNKTIAEKEKAEKDKIRRRFQELLTRNLNNIDTWIAQIAESNPEKAITLLLEFSTFVIPKLRSQEVKVDADVKQENITQNIIVPQISTMNEWSEFAKSAKTNIIPLNNTGTDM
jgi:hypothetical protein